VGGLAEGEIGELLTAVEARLHTCGFANLAAVAEPVMAVRPCREPPRSVQHPLEASHGAQCVVPRTALGAQTDVRGVCAWKARSQEGGDP
jgi:hypothetical protein